jgi:epoxyqueuosine reductase
MHVCCGPCFVYPYFDLKDNYNNIEVTGFFYNPNIHPFLEFKNRLNALKDFSDKEKINMIYDEEYGLEKFLKQIYFQENHDSVIPGLIQNSKVKSRCLRCYIDRLEQTAKKAKENNADAFSSTMFLSPYQDHEVMIDICNKLSEKYNIEFFYKDWRPFYRQSIPLSKEYNLYRQKYCGCVFSEYERYNDK